MPNRKQIIQEAILNELSSETRERYKKAAKGDLQFIRKVLHLSKDAPSEERIKDMFSSLADEPEPRENVPGSRRWIHGTKEGVLNARTKRVKGLRRLKKR